MTTETLGLLFLMFMHWVADFLCQPRWMAEGKGSSFRILTLHVAVYTFILTAALGMVLIPCGLELWLFAGANFVLHWLIDFMTSRLNHYFYKDSNMRAFWICIGADQYLHFVCLLLTYTWLRN